MDLHFLLQAIATAPPGPWAVAVSGGADSTALLHLLHHHRADLQLHVAHLDHETRAGASADDARFVKDLCSRWNLPLTLATRAQIERTSHLPPNPNLSSRFRDLRHALYERVVTTHRLQGVLLAHHADDQAETVLQRLLRGAHVPNVHGMSRESRVRNILLLRPLLDLPRALLRDYLINVDQAWREDASNASDEYLRNRLRAVLREAPYLTPALLNLHAASSRLRDWTRRTAPTLMDRFPASSLDRLPTLIASESARRWLIDRGVPPDEITPDVIERLLEMARDAATPSRQDFPNHLRVRRRTGILTAEPIPPPAPAPRPGLA